MVAFPIGFARFREANNPPDDSIIANSRRPGYANIDKSQHLRPNIKGPGSAIRATKTIPKFVRLVLFVNIRDQKQRPRISDPGYKDLPKIREIGVIRKYS